MSENINFDNYPKFLIGWKSFDLPSYNLNDWKYVGGNYSSHANYFKMIYPNQPFPEYNEKCICGVHIIHNCYIECQDNIAILGRCCITRFFKNCNRTCEICGVEHKTRNQNRCKDCKTKKEKPLFRNCIVCGDKIEFKPRHTKCFDCYIK
jgi:hypothetical protein